MLLKIRNALSQTIDSYMVVDLRFFSIPHIYQINASISSATAHNDIYSSPSGVGCALG